MKVTLAILACIIAGDGGGEVPDYPISEMPRSRFVKVPNFDKLEAPYDVTRFIWCLDRSGPRYIWYKDPYWTTSGFFLVHPVEMYGDFDNDGDIDLRDIAKLQVKASEGLKNDW